MKRNQNDQRNSLGLDRRGFLRGASVAAASLALPGAMRAQNGVGQLPLRDILIYIFLRGGADGLSMAVPYADSLYATLRPTIAVQNYTTLNGTWALPQALSPLLGAYGNGDLAILPASGVIEDKNRSHFVQMDRIEFGTPPVSQMYTASITDGFVARHLKTASFPTESALRGLMMQKLATKSFAQGPKSLAINDVENFEFPGEPLMGLATAAMHDLQDPPLSTASSNTFGAIDYLNQVDYNAPIGNYPNTEFGRRLEQVAALILNGDPPEVIEVDLGSWDHHNNQDPNGGTMFDIMDDLARSLEAFYTDMAASYPYGPGTWSDHVTCVTQTEFGRRIAENSSAGTDHGFGSCSFALGGRVNGGIYDGGWVSLSQNMDADGDVDVLTDHRDVFTGAFTTLLQQSSPQNVYFPGYAYTNLGLFT